MIKNSKKTPVLFRPEFLKNILMSSIFNILLLLTETNVKNRHLRANQGLENGFSKIKSCFLTFFAKYKQDNIKLPAAFITKCNKTDILVINCHEIFTYGRPFDDKVCEVVSIKRSRRGCCRVLRATIKYF